MPAVTFEQSLARTRVPRRVLGIAAIAGAAVVFDGYDLQALAYSLPKIVQTWGLSPIQAGLLGSYTFVGLFIGAVSLGALGDRWGRKRALVLGVFVFAVFMGTAGFARGYAEFAVLRLLASIGMGGVLPGTIAMLSEYVSANRRASMIAIGAGCFTTGFAVAASVASVVVPAHGWRPMFHLSYLAILVGLLMLAWVPESPSYLASRNRYAEALEGVRRLYPALAPAAESVEPSVFFSRPRGASAQVRFGTLWQGEYLPKTVVISFLYLFLQFVVYAVDFWMVSLLVMHGFPLVSSYSYAIEQAVAATLGGLALGWILDRTNQYLTLIIAFSLGGVSLVLFSLSSALVALYVLNALVGSLIIGGQNTVHVLVTSAYRTETRATGLGWALGVGRLGGLLGPLIGGYLLSLRLPYPVYFVAFAIPAVLCSVTIVLLRVVNGRGRGEAAISGPALPGVRLGANGGGDR
jgi:AAHS family benzoate transporter-like MFS transporter